MSDLNSSQFPPKPEKPNEEDCCKSDCEKCIFNVYEKKLEEWEKMCWQIRQKQCIYSGAASVLSEIKFAAFQLIAANPLTENTTIYRFQILESELNCQGSKYSPNLNINIGQHLILKYKGTNDDNLVITRSYTPISDAKLHMRGCFEVLIKVYPQGKMSQYVQSWNIGEIVYWRGPLGDFSYSKNKFQHVIMCCAGTGIAPMFQIIKSVIENEDDETFMYLLYSCRKYRDVLLSNEISQLRSFWNFSSCIYITQEDPQNIRYGDNVERGRINKTVLHNLLFEKQLSRTLVLICGSDSFNNDIANFASDLGVSNNNIWIF